MRASAITARVCLVLFLASALVSACWTQPPSKLAPASEARLDRTSVKKFVTQHCTSCHSGEAKKAGLDLDALGAEDVAAHPEAWEKVVRKLAARQMPPVGKPRPDEKAYQS